MCARLVHFEIAAEDVDRIVEFYSEALGWTFRGPLGEAFGEYEGYQLFMTGDEETSMGGGVAPGAAAARPSAACAASTAARASTRAVISASARRAKAASGFSRAEAVTSGPVSGQRAAVYGAPAAAPLRWRRPAPSRRCEWRGLHLDQGTPAWRYQAWGSTRYRPRKA